MPAKALREALVNALVHRLYVKRGSSVSLAIYDDRVEIINPGTFPSNITLAELRAGNKSEPRNPTIARVMYSRKTVETWGRGIKLILDECAKANLPEPQIVAESGYTKTVFMRPAQNAKTKSTLKTTQKTTLKTTQKTTQKILSLIRQNPSITRMQISDAIGLSLEGVKWNLNKLKATGIVRRVGPDRGGHWEIIGE